MDAYEAVIRRAGARQLGVIGAGPYDYYGQEQTGGGASESAGGGIMIMGAGPYTTYGKGPVAAFVPVIKPAPCACPNGMNPDSTKPPQCGWPDEYNSQLRGKALNDARAKSVDDFNKACGAWKASHCFDPAILEIRRRVQQQQSSVWPLSVPASQSFMPLYPVRTSAPVVQTAQTQTPRLTTASGFQMNVTPMDFTAWMQAQGKRA
jgi:hypothetical protein